MQLRNSESATHHCLDVLQIQYFTVEGLIGFGARLRKCWRYLYNLSIVYLTGQPI
jgi:hypothetical protein